MKFGSLFAGIGGFDLAFKRHGFSIIWQVELNEWCRNILAKNFPEAKRYENILKCGENLERVDVIAGGFPCQDISQSGDMAGIDGARSGLWREYKRIIRLLRPEFALIENVAALVGLGLERVLCDLAEIGYDAEWQVVSAANIGAAQWRERIWILAYPGYERVHQRRFDSNALQESEFLRRASRNELSRKQGISDEILVECRRSHAGEHPHWKSEPNMARVAHGVSRRMDRIKGLGNAVVPQLPELYASRIAKYLRDPQ